MSSWSSKCLFITSELDGVLGSSQPRASGQSLARLVHRSGLLKACKQPTSFIKQQY